MDPTLMGIFIFVLVVLFMVFTFATIAGKRDRAHRERKLELEARIEEAKAAQGRLAQQDNSAIEDRLRVLERIVTDPANDLSRQIEGLRQDRENVR